MLLSNTILRYSHLSWRCMYRGHMSPIDCQVRFDHKARLPNHQHRSSQLLPDIQICSWTRSGLIVRLSDCTSQVQNRTANHEVVILPTISRRESAARRITPHLELLCSDPRGSSNESLNNPHLEVLCSDPRGSSDESLPFKQRAVSVELFLGQLRVLFPSHSVWESSNCWTQE